MQLLAAKRAVLVISSGVMADLDFLKSGDEDVNRNAREAARLLEKVQLSHMENPSHSSSNLLSPAAPSKPKAINEHDPCVVIEARQEAGALSLDADAEVADLGSADRRILACAVALSLKQQHSDMVALLTTNALLETAVRQTKNKGQETHSAQIHPPPPPLSSPTGQEPRLGGGKRQRLLCAFPTGAAWRQRQASQAPPQAIKHKFTLAANLPMIELLLPQIELHVGEAIQLAPILKPIHGGGQRCGKGRLRCAKAKVVVVGIVAKVVRDGLQPTRGVVV